MRRTVCLLAIALLVLPSLGSDAPKEYDGTTKRDDVQGTWEFVGFERDGKILPPAFSEVMIYRGGAYTRIIEEKFVLRGRYRADPGHTRMARSSVAGLVLWPCVPLPRPDQERE